MHYTNYFKEIATTAKEEGIYIGMGNPNGKILIIGKELAIDEEKEKHVSDKTIKRNPADWVYNIENPQEEIPNCVSNENLNLFNPLFPYKGMEKKQQPAGHTWRKYQLLYETLSDTESEIYTFYENFFISELNQIPSKYSSLQNSELRAIWIKKRIEVLFKTDFFQSFPIVIVASGHYPREHNIDLCELFDIDFIPPTRHVDDNTAQWYNLHKSKSKTHPKLLIHTRQLSMDVTNRLIEEIANEIKLFCKENKIAL